MQLSIIELTHIFPEITILVMACVTLLFSLFFEDRFTKGSYYLAQFALLIALFFTIKQLHQPVSLSFSSLFRHDLLADLLKIFIYISVFFAFLYSQCYLSQRKIPRGEYYVLGLFSTLGMMVLVSAYSFITLYLGLELLSLPLYAMVAMQRDSAKATEAAIKYFVMGAIASAMLLYGMSILYGITGSLDLSTIAQALTSSQVHPLLPRLALVFILVGVGFKLAAAPFHMWAPDVYTGAPTSVTLFLSTAPKLAALGMLLRFFLGAMPSLVDQWQPIFIIMAILSMVIGNLFAIAQTNIKRMLAYSAIAHVGYMFLGLIAATPEGYSAAIFYLLIYSLMALGSFGLLLLLSQKKFEAENLEDLRGLNQKNPWFAFMMLLIMLSMAGVPPTVGFFAKLLVLKALVSANFIWLAALALGFAILGAFYYIRVIKLMYFDKPVTDLRIKCPVSMRIAMSVNGLVLLGLGLFPTGLIELCRLVQQF